MEMMPRVSVEVYHFLGVLLPKDRCCMFFRFADKSEPHYSSAFHRQRHQNLK